MRITRFVAPALLTVFAVACDDGAATSPGSKHAHGADNRVASSESVTIPAPNGFTSTALARGSFPDEIDATFKIKLDNATNVVHVDDPSQMIMARITMAPGGALPWHTHPGPALVTVASGEITVVHSTCEVRRYPAGSSFMDAGQGHVHTAFNPGAVETVLYVTYLDVPVGQAPLIPVQGPAC